MGIIINILEFMVAGKVLTNESKRSYFNMYIHFLETFANQGFF